MKKKKTVSLILAFGIMVCLFGAVNAQTEVTYGNVGTCNVSGQISGSSTYVQNEEMVDLKASTSSINTTHYLKASLVINGDVVLTSATYDAKVVSTAWRATRYGNGLNTVEGDHYVDDRNNGGTYWFGYTNSTTGDLAN